MMHHGGMRGRSMIDPRNNQGLRHIFNLNDPQTNPEAVDMNSVQPVTNMNFEGYAKWPDDDNYKEANVTIRSTSDQDPTIAVDVINPGLTAMVAGGIPYGHNVSCYVYNHSIIVTVGDPLTLAVSMNGNSCKFESRVNNGLLNYYVDSFRLTHGENFCKINVPVGCYDKAGAVLPLTPVILHGSEILRITCNIDIFNSGGFPALTLEGLAATYRAQALLIPYGAPIPQLNFHRSQVQQD